MGRRGGPAHGAKSTVKPKTKTDHSDVSESSEGEDNSSPEVSEPERKKMKKAKDPESDDHKENSDENLNQKENSEQEVNDSDSEDENTANKSDIEIPKVITYDCSMCFFTTTSDEGFLKHLDDLHRRDMGYWCKACGKAYETAAQLLEHIREFCDNVKHFQHTCGFANCMFETNEPANLIFHFRNEHKGKYLFPCGQCEQQFTILTSLVLHQQDKCSNKDLCSLQGSSSKPLSKETKDSKNSNNGTTSEKRFRCSLCTFVTPQQKKFVEHHNDLHMRDLCCCKRCGKVNKNADILVEHIAKNECTPNRFNHPCGTEGCDFETHDPLAFRNHIRNGHPRTSLQTCDGCKKQFTIIPLLIMHIQEECSELNTEGRELPESNGNSEDTIESIKIDANSNTEKIPPKANRGRGRGGSRGTRRGRGRGRGTTIPKRGRVVREKTPGSSDESEVDDPQPAPSRSSGRVSKKVSYAHNSDSDDDY